jgi:hypothetical protein
MDRAVVELREIFGGACLRRPGGAQFLTPPADWASQADGAMCSLMISPAREPAPEGCSNDSHDSNTTAQVLTRRRFGQAVTVTAASLTFLSPQLASAETWEEIDNQDGIQVFRMKLPGSPLHAFRGKAVVSAPLDKVIWVLSDNQHRTEWVDRLVKSIVLERRGDYESILYQHYSTPPGASDRDFVYRAKARSREDGTAVLDIASVSHPQAPPTVGVRGELTKCSYILTPQGKNKTHVDVMVMTDPKGNLPGWLINLVQKSWPRNTLMSMREHLLKPFIGRLPPPPVQ